MNWNKILVRLTCALYLCWAASCTSKETFGEEPRNPEEAYVKLHFSLSGPAADSRIQMRPDGSGNFTAGDKIGLYINSWSERKTYYKVLTYNGKEWLPLISPSEMWKDGKVVELTAFYPAQEETPEEQKHTYSFPYTGIQDQTSDAAYQQADMLWTRKKELPPNCMEASFSFSHTLFRLQMDVSGITEGAQVKEIKVYGGNKGFVELNGEHTMFHDGGEETHGWYLPHKDPETPGRYSVILFPQCNVDGTPEGKLELDVTLTDNRHVTYSFSPEERMKSKSGASVLLRLNSGVDKEYANQKRWLYGIQAPLFPESPWETSEFGSQKLRYKEGYGWFDANKRNELDSSVGDVHQCWAAVASNLIHWWMNVNEPWSSKYVEWYNKKHPDTPFPDTKFYPLTEENIGTPHGGSKIFAYFTERFVDEGGFADQGVNWFFTGKVPTEPENTKTGGGFFKEVFPDGIATNAGGIGKEHFNQLIKQALENRQAIGYSIKGHVQNIWGVEFDEKGVVNYVYNVDNDYVENDVLFYGGASATRVRIGYSEDGTITMINYRPATEDKPATGTHIVRLFLLGTGGDTLEKYVKQHCLE